MSGSWALLADGRVGIANRKLRLLLKWSFSVSLVVFRMDPGRQLGSSPHIEGDVLMRSIG